MKEKIQTENMLCLSSKIIIKLSLKTHKECTKRVKIMKEKKGGGKSLPTFVAFSYGDDSTLNIL